MAEFCAPEFKIYLSKGDGTFVESTLTKMLAFSFTKDDLPM